MATVFTRLSKTASIEFADYISTLSRFTNFFPWKKGRKCTLFYFCRETTKFIQVVSIKLLGSIASTFTCRYGILKNEDTGQARVPEKSS